MNWDSAATQNIISLDWAQKTIWLLLLWVSLWLIKYRFGFTSPERKRESEITFTPWLVGPILRILFCLNFVSVNIDINYRAQNFGHFLKSTLWHILGIFKHLGASKTHPFNNFGCFLFAILNLFPRVDFHQVLGCRIYKKVFAELDQRHGKLMLFDHKGKQSWWDATLYSRTVSYDCE